MKDEYINELGNKGLFDVLEGRKNDIVKYQGRVITDSWQLETGEWMENNGYNVGEISIGENWNKKKIAVYLHKLDYIPTADLRVIDVVELGSGIEIALKKDGMPLFYMWVD